MIDGILRLGSADGPLSQGGIWRFDERIRCGHVSGLWARCIDRWP